MDKTDELRNRYLNDIALRSIGLAGLIRKYAESPIEECLTWALIGSGCETYDAAAGTRGGIPGLVAGSEHLIIYREDHSMECIDVLLQPRVMAGGREYRLDIAYGLTLQDIRGTTWVAVECDGHDFHEKTKEQAESDKRRDRDLQSIGFLVARFTGSEIVRAPAAAAQSVIDLAYSNVISRRETWRRSLAVEDHQLLRRANQVRR